MSAAALSISQEFYLHHHYRPMAHVASETRAAQTITNAAVKPTVINAFAGRETSAGSRAEQVWKGMPQLNSFYLQISLAFKNWISSLVWDSLEIFSQNMESHFLDAPRCRGGVTPKVKKQKVLRFHHRNPMPI